MNITPSNLELCLKKIAEKGAIGAREAQRLLQDISDRGDQMKEAGVADPYIAAANELAAKVKESAQRDRLDAVRNANIRSSIMQQIDEKGGLAKAETTIRSILHGTNAGDRDSIESQWRGLGAGWQAALSHELQKAGVEKVAISGELDRDVARAIWAKNSGEAAPGVSKIAQQIADAIAPMLDHVRDRLNQAGARIGDAVDYVTHTLHDPAKMRRAGGPGATPEAAFKAWWEATEPLLAEKTFDGLRAAEGESDAAARQRFGKSVFDALISGVHMTPDGAFGLKADANGFVPPSYEGTRNLARKLSQPRVLFWKDGAAWQSYMAQFGIPRSLTEGVMHTLDSGARQTALMEKLGTNPAANLNAVLRRVQEIYRSDLDGVAKFQGRVAGIENVMARLDGSANIPANEMWAKINSTIRTLESTSKLGGVGITHFASIFPTVTSEMVHHGVSRLEALGNLISALIRGKGGAERQAIDAELGSFSHGLVRDMMSRWQADDPIPGRISSMANTFMKYTGIHYVFDNTQNAVREMLANNLARNADKEFGALDPHLSQMIGKYGIGPEEWNLLRKIEDLPVDSGRAYLTPKDALRAEPAGIEALLRARNVLAEDARPIDIERATKQFAQGLSDKLYSYYGDAAAHAVVTPGVRERAAVLGATRPGSMAGELMRYVMQFKMWPLAAMNQVIGREIYMSLSGKEAAQNLFILAALGIPAGYMRMTVNDVALGRPVRDPMDPRTLMAALAQSGGLGIFGDFLFGEVNRMDQGLIGTAGGPAVSDVDQLWRIFNRFRKDSGDAFAGQSRHRNGPFADLWPDLAHFGVNHIPFANLVYLKGALDYMLWYHLYEAASPGWWERTNRRLIRDNDRPMMGYTPGGGIPYSPWGLAQQSTGGQPAGVR